MVNYKNGKIYTIRSLKSSYIYVGSSCINLKDRMTKHKSSYKIGKILGMFKNIVTDISDWYIELYELYPCENKKELEKREGEIIKNIGTLNKRVAGRNAKEYYADNRDIKKKYYADNRLKKIEYQRLYRIKNYDIIKERNKSS